MRTPLLIYIYIHTQTDSEKDRYFSFFLIAYTFRRDLYHSLVVFRRSSILYLLFLFTSDLCMTPFLSALHIHVWYHVGRTVLSMISNVVPLLSSLTVFWRDRFLTVLTNRTSFSLFRNGLISICTNSKSHVYLD